MCNSILYIYRALIAGGGAPEIEVSHQLLKHSQTLSGFIIICIDIHYVDIHQIYFYLFGNIS